MKPVKKLENLSAKLFNEKVSKMNPEIIKGGASGTTATVDNSGSTTPLPSDQIHFN